MRAVMVTSYGKTFLECFSKSTKSSRYVQRVIEAAYKRWPILHMRTKGNALLYYTPSGMCALSIEGIGLTHTQKVRLLKHPRVRSIELHKDFRFTIQLRHGYKFPHTGKSAWRGLTYSDAVTIMSSVT